MYPGQQPPQHPGKPGQPGQAGGAIAVTTRYHWSAFLLGLFKPEVTINGQTVARTWGRTVIPVAPGQHHLHVHVPYLLPPRIGNADLPVAVHPGQTVELEYKTPMIVFMNGALGAPPQKYPGFGIQIGLMIFLLLMILCSCGLTIFSASMSASTSSYGLGALGQSAGELVATLSAFIS